MLISLNETLAICTSKSNDRKYQKLDFIFKRTLFCFDKTYLQMTDNFFTEKSKIEINLFLSHWTSVNCLSLYQLPFHIDMKTSK